MKPILKKDSELHTKEEIQARINSIQKQFDKENDTPTGRNGVVKYGDMERKLSKLRKLTERREKLLKKLKGIKS